MLERYELLYEVGLVGEAPRDGGTPIRRGCPRWGRVMTLDHRRILATALGRLRGKTRYRPVVFELLPETFTLNQLQRVVEALSGQRLHKQNFRRLVEHAGLVEGTGLVESQTGGRPAELFRFRREVLRERRAPGVRPTIQPALIACTGAAAGSLPRRSAMRSDRARKSGREGREGQARRRGLTQDMLSSSISRRSTADRRLDPFRRQPFLLDSGLCSYRAFYGRGRPRQRARRPIDDAWQRQQLGLLPGRASGTGERPMSDMALAYTPDVARATAPIYARLHRVIPELEWGVHAPYVHAILRLKRERRAVVLAHNYQTPEIFHGVADITGDSLQLAREAAATDADVIVLCGVHFMAETAKILNPGRTVLIPDAAAGCSLAESITAEDVRQLKAAYPGVPVVTYVNTSAAVKAESDICCTSANAVEVVESLGVPRVIFLPGRVPRNVGGEPDEAWRSCCGRATAKSTSGSRPPTSCRCARAHPGIRILAHPECPPDVLREADFVGSTAGMVQHVRGTRPPSLALITECSMSDNVAAEFPDLDFVRPCNLCPHMKRISLSNIRDSLVHARDQGGSRRRSRRPRAAGRGTHARGGEPSMTIRTTSADVVIVGAGVAGLATALGLAHRRVHVICKGTFGATGASPLAQGGIAAAVGPGRQPAVACRRHRRGLGRHGRSRHGVDGHRRGAGCRAAGDPAGREFDRDTCGRLALGREAGHTRARIVHARDATGAEVVRVATEAVRKATHVTRFEGHTAIDLALVRGRVAGLWTLDAQGDLTLHLAPAVVLATGGIGQLFSHTTNPVEATGDGLAIAARAGARLADLEMVQFHPTALDVGADPMPLVTEALRGAGATVSRRGRAPLPARHRSPRRTRAARRRRPGALSPPAGRRARVARRDGGRRRHVPSRFPDGVRRVPAPWPGPARVADPDCASRPLPHGRHRHGHCAAAPRSRDCGRAAKRRVPGCTAPIGSRATRCWKGLVFGARVADGRPCRPADGASACPARGAPRSPPARTRTRTPWPPSGR